MERVLKVSRQQDGRPEIFYSVQGEGVYTGRPAVFLRLGLCNLACAWCDTRYTWDWKNYNPEEQLLDMLPGDIEPEILKHNCQYLVVTGGEPMMQPGGLLPLLERLKGRGVFIEVETNGTVLPDPKLLDLIDHWSVSPKLESSGNSVPSREIPECYSFFAGLPSCHFKYVIQSEADLKEVQAIVQKYGLARERVILMPEAQNRDDLRERSRWLVEICKARGYLFSTRLHILLWGNMRGV